MNSRERIEAALRRQEPDRTPIFEYVLLSPMADQLLGRPCCDYAGGHLGWQRLIDSLGWEGAVRRYAVDQLDLACRLGHDMMYVVPNPSPPKHSASPAPTIVATEDDPVERVRQRNEMAAYAPPSPDDSFLVYQILQEEMTQRDIDLPILAPAYGHGVWTDVDLMQTMVLEPDVAHEHFALATRRAKALVEKYVSLGIDQVGVGGDFSGNRPLISARLYREFIMPEVRAVSRTVHTAGLQAVNASDGNLWPVIEDFLIGCEVDGYLEIDQRAGMDLRKLKEAYGDRITFYGNIDCGSLLTFGSAEDIRRATTECVEAGMGSGGHIFCVSNAITASVSLQNYVAMVNAYRDFFGLKRLEP